MNSANLGYVELSSKEIVFNNSLSLEMGFPTRLLEIVIQNPNNIDLNYETSRNGKEWKTYKLESNKFDKFYFMNGQKHGFFRIKTENSDFQTYEIKSENQYMINWNEQKGVWDLFLA